MPTPPLPTAYTEHAPPAALRPYVACLWTRGATTDDAAPHRVLPDGCVDVLLATDGDAVLARAVGTMTRAELVPPTPGVRFVAARLRPGAARRMLGVSAAALTDLDVPLAELWGAAPLLHEPLAHRRTLDALTDALLARARGAAPVPRPVEGAVRLLEASRGAVRVEALAPAIGVTRQALARAFAEHVGVPPKTFARVVRMRHALALAGRARRAGWSHVALDLGYHDQAHLAAELRALTGRTPREWASDARADG